MSETTNHTPGHPAQDPPPESGGDQPADQGEQPADGADQAADQSGQAADGADQADDTAAAQELTLEQLEAHIRSAEELHSSLTQRLNSITRD